MNVICEALNIGGVIGEIYYQENSKKNPTFFLLRGGGYGNTDKYIAIAKEGAETGYTVIRVELAEHKNYSDCFFKYFSDYYTSSNWVLAFILRMVIFEMAIRMSTAVKATYEKLLQHPAIDNQKIAIVGFSLGGQAGLKIASENSFIKALVAIMALPNWMPTFKMVLKNILVLQEKSISSSSQQFFSDPRCIELTNELSKLLSPYIRDITDPKKTAEDFSQYLHRVENENFIHGINDYVPRSLLLIAGTNDLPGVLPGNQELHQKLLPLYEDEKDNLELKVYDTDHQFTSDISRKALDFLNKQFKQG